MQIFAFRSLHFQATFVPISLVTTHFQCVHGIQNNFI